MEHRIKEFDSLIDLLEDYKSRNASPEELATAMEQFVEVKARRKGVPIHGTLELTPLCNLDCKMCYVHLSKKQLAEHELCLLTGDQWIYIIQQAISSGMIDTTLTGGEALIYPEFDKIFTFLTTQKIRVKLKTNGLLLTQERVDFLKNNGLTGMQISLYGCSEDSYERVTGVRAFGVVTAAIERVKEAGIPLEVVITPNKYIWDDMEQLLYLVDSLGVKYSVNQGLIEPFEETGRAGISHDLTVDQYIELSKMRAKLAGVQIPSGCMDDRPIIGGDYQENAFGMRCAAGRSLFTVAWNGKVMPCRSIDRISFDALTTPFAEGWKIINEAVKQYPIPRECIGCEFEGFCPVCVVQHGMGAEPGHANKAICYRAQRYFDEGLIIKRKS